MDPSLPGHTPIRVTLDIDGYEESVMFEIVRLDERRTVELRDRTPEQLFLLAESIRAAFLEEKGLVHDMVKRCAERAQSAR